MKQYFINLFTPKSNDEVLDLKITEILDGLFHSNLSETDIIKIVNSVKEQTIMRFEKKRERLVNELHCVVTSINEINKCNKSE
jgi:hypothetical protein